MPESLLFLLKFSVVGSFFLGGVLGSAITLHLVKRSKKQQQQEY